MKLLFMTCGVWLAAFVSGVLGILAIGSGNPDLVGRIILDDKPFCDSFVVQSDRGLAILDWQDGIVTFGESDTIIGPLRVSGPQTFDVVGRGMMKASVYLWTPNLLHAEQAFRDRCGIDSDWSVGTAFVR